jgi:hypothetical protein
MTIDYRKLLKKYMYHVSNQTDDTFIWETHGKPDLVTNEEWETLNILDNELTEILRKSKEQNEL